MLGTPTLHLHTAACTLAPDSAACHRLARWYGPNCSGHYEPLRGAIAPPAPSGLESRLYVPQTRVLEDYCEHRGRHGNWSVRDSEVNTLQLKP